MEEFYKSLVNVFIFMAKALFPKDRVLQREFMLIRVSAIVDKMPQVFEKLGGIKTLRLCRSAKEMKELEKHIHDNEWKYVMRILHKMQAMQEDPKLVGKVSLNKAAFLVDKEIKEELAKKEAERPGEVRHIDLQKQNAPRYKDIWRRYRGVAHLIGAILVMEMDYLEIPAKEAPPFEAFLSLKWEHLYLAAYNQGLKINKIKEGHTKKPIVPAGEFYPIKKPKLATDKEANMVIQKCILPDPSLRQKVSKYKAPVFDYSDVSFKAQIKIA